MEKIGGGGGGVSGPWLSMVSALSQAADTFSPTPDICYTRLFSFGNNYSMFYVNRKSKLIRNSHVNTSKKVAVILSFCVTLCFLNTIV